MVGDARRGAPATGRVRCPSIDDDKAVTVCLARWTPRPVGPARSPQITPAGERWSHWRATARVGDMRGHNPRLWSCRPGGPRVAPGNDAEASRPCHPIDPTTGRRSQVRATSRPWTVPRTARAVARVAVLTAAPRLPAGVVAAPAQPPTPPRRRASRRADRVHQRHDPHRGGRARRGRAARHRRPRRDGRGRRPAPTAAGPPP